MASDDRDAAESGRPPGGRRRRPPPTIEGTASEIAREPVAQSSPEGAAEPPQAQAAADTAAPPDTARESAGAEKPASVRTERPVEQDASWLPIGEPRALLAGGVAGAVVSIVILLVLWLAGAFAPRDDSAALAGKVAALEAQVRDLAARRAPAVDAKTVEDLRARVDVIDAGLRRVDDRLARAESALATPRSAPTEPAVLDRLGAAESMQRALSATIGDLRTRIDELAATARDAKTRADAATEAAAKASAIQADAALRGDIDALAGWVTALERAERTIDQRAAAEDRAVRLAVVADALRAAVERAAPFSTELAAAKALGANAAALAPLDAVAVSGVASAESLARDFDKLAPAMLAAASPPSHDGGILDRLQANAERLVRIHPVGETPGDDPAAGLARAAAKAHRGDVAGALAEVERLPPAVKAPAADWIKAAQARVAAVDAARQLLASSLAALGKPSP